MTMRAGQGAAPLAGLKVLELTVARAGPTAARQLADWGAEVIKIEAPDRIEPADSMSSGSARGRSDFQNLHRNRKSLTLNLKSPDGIETLMRMAESADILIENYRPDVKARLGFDYATVAARNPALIYCSISGFGQDGPYAMRPGVDQIAQGMTGLMSITGYPGDRPLRTGIAIADSCAGLFCAFGILAALHERHHSGQGQWLRSSLIESLLFFQDFQVARWLQEGEIPAPSGNDHPSIRPTGMFQTADGFINIAIVPNMWGRLCGALGLGDMAEDPRFSTGAARLEHSDELNARIEAETRKDRSNNWIAQLNDAGIPCGRVNRMDEVFSDPQVGHLDMVRHFASPSLGELRQLRQPIQMSRSETPDWTGAPTRGAHTEEVLRDFGFSAAEIAALQEAQAI